MNQEKRILVCEDSMEGIFSAVYDGWKECAGGCKVSIQTSFPVSMELFTSYREIATDQSKAGKVMRTILMRLGSEVYEQICLAAASADEDRGTAIYYVLHRAFGGGAPHGKLHGHDGQTQNDEEQQVEQHESAAAALTCHVRELPHISDADRTAGGKEDEPESRFEFFAFH